MNLLKTTILPTDDADLAQRLFRHWVYEVPRVLFVVLGTGPKAEALTQRADTLAGLPPDPRWVIWARFPEQLVPVVSAFSGKKPTLTGPAVDRAFALSLTDNVRDVLTAAEPEPDLVRVLQAYARAEGGAS